MKYNHFAYRFLPNDGYGRLNLKTAQAMIRLGHEVHPYTIDALNNPAWFQQAQGIDFSRVSLQFMPPHEMKALPGRSIGYSMHESEKLPPGWSDHLNQKCQWLIVPSVWMKEVMLNNGVKLPIKIVGGAIDPDECTIVAPHRNRPFTFGALADRGGRKGEDLVWSAFYKAFDHKNKDVRLIIKTRPSMGAYPKLDFSYSNDDRFTIWRAEVDHIADIYAQFDAYIFPTRAEGLGMPPREAAACGLPVIVTRYSGVADDCDEWAYPLEKFTLIESKMNGSGGLWAQPDLDEVVHWMRWLYEHQDDARVKGLKSAQWMRDHATYIHAATKLSQVIATFLGGPRNQQLPRTQPKDPIPLQSHNLARLELGR